jgi:hypothetical protein
LHRPRLALAPIHLQLLGLHADTSAICLNITANPRRRAAR